MDTITAVADGIPSKLHPHPFRLIDHKEQAAIRKQPAAKSAERAERAGARFFCDFGFIRSSTDDYLKPDPERDRIVKSFDGFKSYLAIVDDFTRYTWIFPCRSKHPLLT